jgi:hypothetical protein
MSAFGGKADIAIREECPLVTHSGHSADPVTQLQHKARRHRKMVNFIQTQIFVSVSLALPMSAFGPKRTFQSFGSMHTFGRIN